MFHVESVLRVEVREPVRLVTKARRVEGSHLTQNPKESFCILDHDAVNPAFYL